LKLPLLVSVPHGGVEVPREVEAKVALDRNQIIKDGDEGAARVYSIADDVAGYVSTRIARAVLDVNRDETDRREDGVVKKSTCWGIRVYREPLSEQEIESLLENYYRPYHRRLAELAPGMRLGIDCHTMSAVGPPVGPDPGAERPPICLSDAGHTTCPQSWTEGLAEIMRRVFGTQVAVNSPFRGGYIIRSHCREIPWVQLELSRAPFMSDREKRDRLVEALEEWCGAEPFF